METNYANPTPSRIELDEKAVQHLVSIYKWTNFFSIIGFVGVGIMLLIGLFPKAILGAFNPQFSAIATPIGLIYLFMAVIYIFPVTYLYRFSRLARLALKESSQNTLTEALAYFKKHFQFLGIVTICLLSLYLVIILGYILGKIFLG